MAAIARAAPDERKEMVENLRKPKAAARGQPFPEVTDSDEDDQDEDLEEDSEEETVPYMIEMRATNENGEISFTADLPVDGKYFIREVSEPRGYVTSEEKKEFTFKYEGDDKDIVSFDFAFVNEPTKVEVTKTDITGGSEIPGAHLQVLDYAGNVVDEWVSEENPHLIKYLHANREYELVERKPADGYTTAESIVFTVKDTMEVQKVEMKDDVTKVKISKTDITTCEEIPGAKLTIFNEKGINANIKVSHF